MLWEGGTKMQNTDKKILVLGATGAMAVYLIPQLVDKGYSVVYDSAQKIFDTFEAKKFGKDPDVDITKFYETDLLIIDDLGTECVTQFSVSVLYNLINLRGIDGKATIISTNLTPDEIRNTYKPRIFSRLFGDFKLMRFYGSDIRLQKLKE